MLDFPPHKIAGPYITVPLGDLLAQLTELLTSADFGERQANERTPAETALDTLYSALQTAALTAYVYLTPTDTFLKVVTSFWNPSQGDFPILSVHGRLIDLSPNQTFKADLAGQPLVLFQDDAHAWLIKYGGKSSAPRTIKDREAGKTSKPPRNRKPRYLQALSDKALEYLRLKGDFSAAFTKADLENLLANWAENQGLDPAPSTIRRHIDKAHAEYMLEQKAAAKSA